MFRLFFGDKRGVSEIIASLIIVLIVSVAGVALYSYSLGAFSTSSTSFQLQTYQTEERTRERLSIVAIWRENSTGEDQMNITVLNYGKIELVIDAIYINGTQVSNYSSGIGITVGKSELISVKFTSPLSIQDGDTYELIAVSERGSRHVVYWKA